MITFITLIWFSFSVAVNWGNILAKMRASVFLLYTFHWKRQVPSLCGSQKDERKMAGKRKNGCSRSGSSCWWFVIRRELQPVTCHMGKYVKRWASGGFLKGSAHLEVIFLLCWKFRSQKDKREWRKNKEKLNFFSLMDYKFLMDFHFILFFHETPVRQSHKQSIS